MPELAARKVIGVVVGRKNSKGLPGKNMLPFNGSPLAEWTLRQAEASEELTSVIVSSDDDRILSLGEKYGFITIERPNDLATDSAPVGLAIVDALNRSGLDLNEHDVVVLLEPTSPLRPKGFIDACITRFLTSGADSAVSVGQNLSQHPVFSVVMNPLGVLTRFDGNPLQYVRRQEIQDVFYLDGSFYCSELWQLRNSLQMYGGVVLGLPVAKWQEVEIDDETDFAIAERLGEMYATEL